MFLRLYLKTLHIKHVRDETGSTLWSECSLTYVMCLPTLKAEGKYFDSIKSIL